jgi:hypothetical protein
MELQALLGQTANSSAIREFIQSLDSDEATGAHDPGVKSYSDVVYYNYYRLGFSLTFKAVDGYKLKTGLGHSELEEGKLMLDGIDVYNEAEDEKTGSKDSKAGEFSVFRAEGFELRLGEKKDEDGQAIPRAERMRVERTSTGKDFVGTLGEPSRKGGGAGPSSGSIGIWCEWLSDGVMVEFGGAGASGPQAWDRGGDLRWRVLTIFGPSG